MRTFTESATCFSLVLWISLVMWASAHPSEPMGLNIQKGDTEIRVAQLKVALCLGQS